MNVLDSPNTAGYSARETTFKMDTYLRGGQIQQLLSEEYHGEWGVWHIKHEYSGSKGLKIMTIVLQKLPHDCEPLVALPCIRIFYYGHWLTKSEDNTRTLLSTRTLNNEINYLLNIALNN